MGETKIEWADFTFNPWIGCTEISAACDHCYARILAARYGWAKWGVGQPRIRTGEANWHKPVAWDRAAAKAGVRKRVFCASLADWADAEVPDAWRFDLFQTIAATPNLDWLLLSKRHALVRGFLLRYAGGLKNIRVGMTVEDDKMAEMRLPRLREIARDGWPTFVSYEPALGPVEWERWLDIGCIDWLIAGGESGVKARPPHPDWIRAARNACTKYGRPFHFKQWGEWHTGFSQISSGEAVFKQFTTYQQWVNKAPTWVNGGICLDSTGRALRIGADFMKARDEGRFPVTIMHRVGKKAAGAMLDGREWREFPNDG